MENILITGVNGVLGQAFKKIFKNKKTNQKFFFLNSRTECNLFDSNETSKFFDQNNFDGIIHLAAISGGIGVSGPKYQATLLEKNLKMTLNILDNVVRKKIKKTLLTLSSGMYSPQTKMPHEECDLHFGPCHESSYGYFYAKKIIEPMVRSYRDQYSLDIIGIVPNGIFGENDNFSEHATMLPSIIKRMFLAKKKNERLTVWGDGSPLREFTFSEDMALAFMWCFDNYSSNKIINVGSNEELSIKEMVFIVAELMSFDKSKIDFDTTKPLGVFRKSMNNSNFINLSNFKFRTLKEGIKKTIEWFEDEYKKEKNFYKSRENLIIN